MKQSKTYNYFEKIKSKNLFNEQEKLKTSVLSKDYPVVLNVKADLAKSA